MENEKATKDLPTLETERLTLRKITFEDVEDIYKFTSLEEVASYVTWNAHKTIDETKEFVQRLIKYNDDTDGFIWGIELKENGLLIGTVSLSSPHPKHKSAEIAYALSANFWGKGLITEAAMAAIKFGFEEKKLVRIQAKCLLNNRRSERVLEKVGMTFEGVLRKEMYIKGKHQDLKMYAMIDEDFLAFSHLF